MSRQGTVVHTGANSVIRFERDLAHPPETVFAALTERDELRAWYPCVIEGAWAEGADLTFRFGPWPAGDARSGGNDLAPMAGTVLAYDPPRLLEYTWGDQRLRFELTSTATGTTLVLTHHLATTPDEWKFAAGWHQCLDALGASLDRAAPDMTGAAWEALAAGYRPA